MILSELKSSLAVVIIQYAHGSFKLKINFNYRQASQWNASCSLQKLIHAKKESSELMKFHTVVSEVDRGESRRISWEMWEVYEIPAGHQAAVGLPQEEKFQCKECVFSCTGCQLKNCRRWCFYHPKHKINCKMNHVNEINCRLSSLQWEQKVDSGTGITTTFHFITFVCAVELKVNWSTELQKMNQLFDSQLST